MMGKTPWESYLAHFNIIADINDWCEQEKASFLASSLTGTALNVLSNLPPEKRQNFQSLVKALDGRYGNAHRTELARARFKNRIKQKDESLPDLVEDIERLAHLSYPDAPESITDTLARDQFVDALPDKDMRLRLKQERPQTLQRAQNIALELESFQLANRQMRVRVRAVQLESEKSNAKKYDKDGSDQEKPAEQNLNTTMLQMMAWLEKATQACVEQQQIQIHITLPKYGVLREKTKNVGTAVCLDTCEEIVLRDLQDPLLPNRQVIKGKKQKKIEKTDKTKSTSRQETTGS